MQVSATNIVFFTGDEGSSVNRNAASLSPSGIATRGCYLPGGGGEGREGRTVAPQGICFLRGYPRGGREVGLYLCSPGDSLSGGYLRGGEVSRSTLFSHPYG